METTFVCLGNIGIMEKKTQTISKAFGFNFTTVYQGYFGVVLGYIRIMKEENGNYQNVGIILQEPHPGGEGKAGRTLSEFSNDPQQSSPWIHVIKVLGLQPCINGKENGNYYSTLG